MAVETGEVFAEQGLLPGDVAVASPEPGLGWAMTRRNLRLCALLLKILGRLVRRAQADGKARDLSDLR
ncbi:hypothetical protein [Nonomuraea sp. NPDC003214]